MSHIDDATALLPPPLRPTHSRNVALLLESRIPARLAWVAGGATPRVVAIWFTWDGDALSMATFADSAKLSELHDGMAVAVTIDTEAFPYRSLRLGGPMTLHPTRGLSPEYRVAAARYLGETAGALWCASLGDRDQVVIRVTPTWASVSDMSRSPFLDDPFLIGRDSA
jgi:hypothetical protein